MDKLFLVIVMKEYIEELLDGLNMGILAIDHLVDKIESDKLRDIVLHQRKAYGDLKEKLEHLYTFKTDEVKNKLMLETMIEMKTIVTNDQKIAKMLSLGTHQAILKSSHILNKSKDVDHSIKNHFKEFETISQEYIEKLKVYL